MHHPWLTCSHLTWLNQCYYKLLPPFINCLSHTRILIKPSFPTILSPDISGSQGFHAQSRRSFLRRCSSWPWWWRVSHRNFKSQITEKKLTWYFLSVVEFSSYDSMQNAIRELDGVDLKGSRVTVREVRIPQPAIYCGPLISFFI